MKVTVTKAHILAGNPSDAYRCPVALAIREKFPELLSSHLAVGIDGEVSLTVKNVWRWYSMPKIAREFIERFDHSMDYERQKMEGFTFELRSVRS